MDELYQAIEEKIKAAGYPREISGQAVYEDICDQIEGKENGSYVLLSKFENLAAHSRDFSRELAASLNPLFQ